MAISTPVSPLPNWREARSFARKQQQHQFQIISEIITKASSKPVMNCAWRISKLQPVDEKTDEWKFCVSSKFKSSWKAASSVQLGKLVCGASKCRKSIWWWSSAATSSVQKRPLLNMCERHYDDDQDKNTSQLEINGPVWSIGRENLNLHFQFGDDKWSMLLLHQRGFRSAATTTTISIILPLFASTLLQLLQLNPICRANNLFTEQPNC